MYTNQALVGLNYTFRYAMNGQAGSGGTRFLALCTCTRPLNRHGYEDGSHTATRQYQSLDLGLSVKSVFNYDIINKVIGVELSSNFGPPVSDGAGELVSDRFEADGTPKTTYNNYTVVAVGTKAALRCLRELRTRHSFPLGRPHKSFNYSRQVVF